MKIITAERVADMAGNDHPQALRFLESMAKHGERAAAERFAEEHPLAETADPGTGFEWAEHLCAFLEEHYDAGTVKAIRMDCACGPQPADYAGIKALYEKGADPAAFTEKVNALDPGFTLEYDGESYTLTYPECYCPFVSSSPAPLPAAWCCCTLGYTRRMYGDIFGTEVQVELLDSVKTGGETCRIGITPEKRG